MKTYRVQVSREGSAWIATVENVEGAHTWGRGLRHLDDSVRETIILADDLPDDAQFELDWVFTTGNPEIDHSAATLRERRHQVTRAASELASETDQLVHALREQGLSVRDTATIAGISPARVGQFVAAD